MLYPLTIGEHISVIFGSSKDDHLDDMIELQHLHLDKTAMVMLAGSQQKKDDEEFAVPEIPLLSFTNKSFNQVFKPDSVKI